MRINRLQTLSSRVIVVHPNPGGRADDLAVDTLLALGKDRSEIPKAGKYRMDQVSMWIEAEEIKHMVFYGAHHLKGRENFYVDLGMTCWFVSPEHQATKFLAENHKVKLSRIGLLLETLEESPTSVSVQETSGVTKHANVDTAFPRVPYDDFLTFFSSCREIHMWEEEPYETIVKETTEAHRRARWENDETGQATIESVSQLVHSEMLGAECEQQAICRLRGIQMALFESWHLLKVELRPLIAVLRLDRMKGSCSEVSRRGRGLLDPIPGSLLAIAHLTNLTSREVTELTLGDLADDCSTISTPEETVSVPSDLRSVLRALRIQRLSKYAGEYDALFVTKNPSNQDLNSGWAAARLPSDLDKPVRFTRHGIAAREIGGGPSFHRHLQVVSLKDFDVESEHLERLSARV